ncbi:MAG TPA: hypothetical protein VFW22_08455 [Pseudolabrys sp.]|nr:hypothetical protein [Pseudolabrys sp.]
MKTVSWALALLLAGVASGHAADQPLPVAAPASGWSIQASFDVISLARRKGANVPIADGLGTGDFNLGRQAGGDLRIAAAFRGFGVEGRYLGNFDWNDQRTTGPVTAVFSNPQINFAPRSVTGQYESDFSSYEINAFWQAHPRIRVFGGYRRFSVAEALALDIGGIANFTVATQNRLSGVQAGIALRVLDGADVSPAIAGLFGDVTGRIGRYDNAAALTTTSVGIGGAVPFIAASDSARTTALELDATIGYRLAPNASVYVGYRYLKLQGLALAPENFQSANILTGTATIARADATYDGVFTGIRFGW